MSTLTELEEILRQLPADVRELINMIRAGTVRLSPNELRKLLAALIAAGGPSELIKRALILLARLGLLSPEVLAGAIAEADAVVAAGAVAGGEAAGAAAAGEAGAGAATGAATGGGAGAAAISAATVAAIGALVVEVFSLVNAISLLKGKDRINDALDALNERTTEGLRQLRALRDAGTISSEQFQEEIDKIIRAFSEAQDTLNAKNNELQDALDENFLIRIGEWFYGSTREAPVEYEPVGSAPRRLSMGSFHAGAVMERFAALKSQPEDVLDSTSLMAIRYEASAFARREVLDFLEEQSCAPSQRDAYRRLLLRGARYFSTPADAPIVSFWRKVYDGSPADTFARKQAVLACFRSGMNAAWELALEAAAKDRDPVVRVLAYEILGSITRTVGVRTETFLGLAEQAAASEDNAARLGAVCGLMVALQPDRPPEILKAGSSILRKLVTTERNCYIAGMALGALAPLAAECELGSYLPATDEQVRVSQPSKADVLVGALNAMAAIGDRDAFLRLTEHTGRVDIGEANVEKLFAVAPVKDARAILAIDGIGSKTFDVMADGLYDNLTALGIKLEATPSIMTLRDAARRLASNLEPTREELLIVSLNVLAHRQDKDGFRCLTELQGNNDIGEAGIEVLFTHKPYRSIDDLVNLPGIGGPAVERMAEGLMLNLKRSGVDIRKIPSPAVLHGAIETLHRGTCA